VCRYGANDANASASTGHALGLTSGSGAERVKLAA
jgi:hypothetical protein